MKIAGTQFRSFYPQKSLNFNFSVSDYSSNNFEVGLSGTSYVRFKFKDGLIKDNSNNIIGTFDKKPIEIKTNISGGKYNYYLNSIPIAKDLTLVNETPVFSSIVAKILDISGYINLEAYIEGDTVPTLSFLNFNSDNVATSGTISGNNNYPIDIFSIKSNSIAGTFQHGNLLNPGSTLNFFNYDVKTLDIGSIVQLNLETNFGNASYELQTRSVGDITPPEETGNPEVINSEKFYLLLNDYPLQGEITKTGGISSGVYQIEYILPPVLSPTDNDKNKLNLLFEYDVGRTGNIELLQTKQFEIYYSGNLTVNSGVASGILSNNDFSYLQEDYVLDTNNKQDVTFFPESVLTGYFDNLYPTGIATYTLNVTQDDSFKIRIKDTELAGNSNYIVDLGGETSVFPASNNSIEKEYSKLIAYKGNIFNQANQFFVITKEIKESDKGKILLGTETVSLTGNILSSEIDYDNPFILEGNINKSVDIYPYRGVAYAYMTEYNSRTAEFDKLCFSLFLSGTPAPGSSDVPYLLLNGKSDQDYNETMFFKNISKANLGRYIIQSENELIKGRVIVNPPSLKSFVKTGLYFEYPIYGTTFDIKNLFLRFKTDPVQYYEEMGPFDKIENPKTHLFKDLSTDPEYSIPIVNSDGSPVELKPEINWDENNFLCKKDINSYPYVREGENEEYLSHFYSNVNPKLGIVFQNPFFVEPRFFGTGIMGTNGVYKTNKIYIPATENKSDNKIYKTYINHFKINTTEEEQEPCFIGTKNTYFRTKEIYSSNSESFVIWQAASREEDYSFGDFYLYKAKYSLGNLKDYRIEFLFRRELNYSYLLTFAIKVPNDQNSVSYIQILENPDTPKGFILNDKSITSATSNSITHIATDIVPDIYKEHILRIISGPGAGQDRLITSNTVDPLSSSVTFFVTPNWTTTPDNTSKFAIHEKLNWANIRIYKNLSIASGTATGGSTTTLIDNKGWPVNFWVSKKLNIKAGTGAGNVITILSNTNDTLTFATQAFSINSTSVYEIDLDYIEKTYGTENTKIYKELPYRNRNDQNDIAIFGPPEVTPINNSDTIRLVSFVIPSIKKSKKYFNSKIILRIIGDAYKSPIYTNGSDFFYPSQPNSDTEFFQGFSICGQTIVKIDNENNFELNVRNIGTAYEDNDKYIQKSFMKDIEAFKFFIHTLYKIKCHFIETKSLSTTSYTANPDGDLSNFYEGEQYRPPNDTSWPNRNEIFDFLQPGIPPKILGDLEVKYKGDYVKTPDTLAFQMYKFFKEQINPYLSKSLFLFTDFKEIHLERTESEKIEKITYSIEKYPQYSLAIPEIIYLLKYYKNFSHWDYISNDGIKYRLPIGPDDTNYLPITNEELLDIPFSGYSERQIELNIDQTYGRYYPYSDNENRPELFGYFYENTQLRERINPEEPIPNKPPNIPYGNYRTVNLKSSKLIRLIKNDNSLIFSKDINDTLSFTDSFFKVPRITTIDMRGIFYEAKKKIGDVWKIEIKNSANDATNIYESRPSILINKSDYKAEDIGRIKNNQINYVYLKITHTENEILNIEEDDKAKITLYITSNNQEIQSNTYYI